jgi:hypothetical protein
MIPGYLLLRGLSNHLAALIMLISRLKSASRQ